MDVVDDDRGGAVHGGAAASARLAGLDVHLTERFWQSRSPMLVSDLAGDVLAVNAALVQVWGEPASWFPGRPVREVASPEVAELLAGLRGADHDVAVSVHRPDGATRHVAGSWTVVHRDGAPWYATAAFVDVTDSVRREAQALARSREWEQLARGAFEVAYRTDADGRVLDVTSGLRDQLGWARRDVLGRIGAQFVHPQDREAFEAARLTALGRPDEPVEVECRVATASGEWAWVAERLTGALAPDGSRSVTGNVVRIDARRQAQAELQSSEARYRARFEQSLVAQAALTPAGTFEQVNDALCRLLGRTAQDLLGRPVADVRYDRRSLPGGEAGLQAVLTGRQPSASYEQVLEHRSGRPVPVRVDLTAALDDAGHLSCVSALVLDLSEVRDARTRLRRQEQFFSALSRRATDAGFVSTEHGDLVFTSPALGRLLGQDDAVLDLDDLLERVHPEDRAAAVAHYRAVVQDGPRPPLRLRAVGPDGVPRWLELVVSDERDTDVGGLVTNVRDVTEQVAADAALRESEARHRAIAQTAQDGIWVVSATGRTTYTNPRLHEVLGVAQHELADRDPRSVLPLAGGGSQQRVDVVYLHPDGSARVLQVTSAPLLVDDPAAAGELHMVSDVTGQRQLEQELRHTALHDRLTGLPNRALLHDRIEHALARSVDPTHRGTAVLLVELDGVASVNDARGHSAGDAVLVEVGERLRAALRAGETAARLGGDQFVLVCEDADEHDASARAAELLALLATPFDLQGERVWLTASVGIATTPAPDVDDLLRFAAQAVHRARATGRGQAAVYDAALGRAVDQRFELAALLRSSLEQEEGLRLHYQPLLALGSGAVLGFEALLRWHHPELGDVSPASFVPVAERSGLSPLLDRWVFRHAVQGLLRLREGGGAPPGAYVSVNLSRHNLGDPTIVEEFVQVVHDAGVAPADVLVEVTESALATDDDPCVVRLLREAGFLVALDDFGTGYSSLAQLRQLPVTHLKVDASFVDGIEDDEDALAVVSGIADLGRALRLTVVAEGVETAGQAAVLRRLHCQVGQGFLWSPALPLEQARAFAAQWALDPGVPGAPDPDPTLTPTPAPAPAPAPVPRARAAVVEDRHGLARMLEMHGRGASPHTVASALNAAGYRNPSGQRWHGRTVARVLSVQAYAQRPEAGQGGAS